MFALYDYSLVFWLLSLVGVIFTGISKSGFAGGAGVVAVPLMALVIPVASAAFILLPLLILMDLKTIQYYRKTVSWSIVRKIIPAALIGIILGGFLLGVLSNLYLQIILGTISILFAAWHKLAPLIGKMKGAAWFWGTTSGLTSTLIHAGGPPINIFLIAQKLPKQVWLGTTGIFFAFMNSTKIVPYGLTGDWTLTMIMTSLVLIPVALFGVWLGKIIQNRITEKQFMLICRALLFVSGVLLVLKALGDIIPAGG